MFCCFQKKKSQSIHDSYNNRESISVSVFPSECESELCASARSSYNIRSTLGSLSIEEIKEESKSDNT
jgi:hypothetical protein